MVLIECCPPINAIVKGRLKNGKRHTRNLLELAQKLMSGGSFNLRKILHASILNGWESGTSPSSGFHAWGQDAVQQKMLVPLAWRFEFRLELKHFVGGRNPAGNTITFDAGQVLSKSENAAFALCAVLTSIGPLYSCPPPSRTFCGCRWRCNALWGLFPGKIP